MTAKGGDDLMGWIDKVKDIIVGLRASGKNEKEIEEIVQQATNKATIKVEQKGIEEKLAETSVNMAKAMGTFARDAVDSLCYALEVMQIASKGWNGTLKDNIRRQQRQQTNNWRKIHGLPMRRKGKGRR